MAKGYPWVDQSMTCKAEHCDFKKKIEIASVSPDVNYMHEILCLWLMLFLVDLDYKMSKFKIS